ncbi:hypothetical protein BO86DRAFT_395368 [Aspergillus japonicus CBS 114.51]|uniref:Uncharacterized protein n=2 Tax=Aspergillus TaxID=5052 RepID=A0A2V5H8C9_ASPV1|nr:hypothetical protein BO86DRAFT_395368 [Aspergillus japonicus CBS 114.51]PYI18442.1 hypothetical protein BO99DRAFT_433539 [Aspergillus violaceofuscus CBS 115571]RAH85922.1 hypothetical protein BO86DRAFT_395368 [Aspergillus japonicus CBS 114.51]
MSLPVRSGPINPEAEADEALLQHFDVKDGKDGTRLLQCHLCKRLVRDAISALEWHLQYGCREVKKRSKSTSARSSKGSSHRRNGEGLDTHVNQRRFVCRRCHENVGGRTASLRAHVQTCLQGRARTVEGEAFVGELQREHFEISPDGGGGGEEPSLWRRATCRYCQNVMQDRMKTMVEHLVCHCRAAAYGRVQGRSDTPGGSSAA